jgi:glycosyltransferase involved in cell wall biosynthesis
MDAESAMNVDIIVPVHNQARTLERQISGLYAPLKSRFPYRWKLLLVDHGSTDGGFWEARKLEERYSGVQAVQVALEGRGRALKRGSQGLGDVFCYLDAANLPKDLVRDEFWFFDTELLVLAQARGCRIKQTVISRERPDRAAIEEPLPELMRRILDLRQRLRGTAANPADRDPRTGAEVSPQEGRRTHAQDQGEPR